jgi:hypothetical protein
MSSADVLLPDPPVRWTHGGYEYDVRRLEPFEGYWVRNLSETTMTLKIPSVEALPESKQAAIAVANRTTANTHWSIRLIAVCSGITESWNFAGVRADASDTWDRNDRFEAPMTPARSMSLYFPHQSWGKHAGNYTADIRGTSRTLDMASPLECARRGSQMEGYLWRFDVAKNFCDKESGDEAWLQVITSEELPAEAEVFLVDRQLARVVDILAEKDYTFYLRERGFVTSDMDARFLLLVGSEDFIESHRTTLPDPPKATALHQNYPNPFTGSTIVSFDVCRSDVVDLRVYDSRGALVKVLYRHHCETGRHEVRWDGMNQTGGHASPGVYYLRLKTECGLCETRKALLLR